MDYGKTLEILRLTDGECWHLEDAADDVIKPGSRIFTAFVGSAVAEEMADFHTVDLVA